MSTTPKDLSTAAQIARQSCAGRWTSCATRCALLGGSSMRVSAASAPCAAPSDAPICRRWRERMGEARLQQRRRQQRRRTGFPSAVVGCSTRPSCRAASSTPRRAALRSRSSSRARLPTNFPPTWGFRDHDRRCRPRASRLQWSRRARLRARPRRIARALRARSSTALRRGRPCTPSRRWASRRHCHSDLYSPLLPARPLLAACRHHIRPPHPAPPRKLPHRPPSPRRPRRLRRRPRHSMRHLTRWWRIRMCSARRTR